MAGPGQFWNARCRGRLWNLQVQILPPQPTSAVSGVTASRRQFGSKFVGMGLGVENAGSAKIVVPSLCHLDAGRSVALDDVQQAPKRSR